MALSKSTFSVKMRGEIQRELPFIRKLSKFYFEGKRQAATSRLLADWGESHNGCFWDFLSKKYLRQISILGTNKWKIWKSKSSIVMPILKLTTGQLYSFRFPIHWCLKLSFVWNDFLDKNSKKQPLWKPRYLRWFHEFFPWISTVLS